MSLKDKFEKNVKESHKSGFIKKSTLETFSGDVESKDFVFHSLESRKEFIPDIDYASASNFARFGSAKRYFLDSTDRIINTYPYDGSAAEKTAWANSSSYLDKYVFEKEYPRATGYAIFSPHAAGGWGTLSTPLITDPTDPNWAEGYGSPSDQEYIAVRSGPNVDNVYNTGTFQEENLKFDLSGSWKTGDFGGATVEFWLKKDSYIPTLTGKEVIFDLWNGETDPDAHGRLLIELTSSGGHPHGAPTFLVTAMSGVIGGAGGGVQRAIIGSGSSDDDVFFGNPENTIAAIGTASVADNNWHHYAIALRNDTGSIDTIDIDFYVDGRHHESVATGTKIQRVMSNPNIAPAGGNIAHIGALRAAPPNNSNAAIGWGKLSGSIDEFRYWKTYRNSKDIAKNYFTHVFGGTNTDTSNTKLGVYYKFNEGIVGNPAFDSVVLDYSGRVSNGRWVGLDTGSHRSEGSAINESSASSTPEFKDPILYRNHRDIINYIEEKELSGTLHDSRNNSYLLNNLPGWILDEQDLTSSGSVGELTKLTQVIASYFDKLYHQSEFLSKLKHVDYEKQNSYPAGMLNSILQSYGMNSADFFIDSDVVQALFRRDEDRLFEKSLHDIKNVIYKNIHNNLISIYKSKGTEKALRNVLRCFGIDDEVFRLNVYNKNGVYELKDHERITTERKRFVDFSTAQTGTIFQATSSTSILGGEQTPNMSQAYINFSTADFGNSHTWEAGVFFPDRKDFFDPNFISVSQVSASVFGVTNVGSSPSPLTTHTGQYDQRITLYAVKVDDLGNPDIRSKKAKFVVKEGTGTGDLATTPFTSSIFDLYEGTHWNFALRWSPRNDWGHLVDAASSISNSHLASGSAEKPGINPGGGGSIPDVGGPLVAEPTAISTSDPVTGAPLTIDRSYNIELYGVQMDAGEIVREISGTVFHAPPVTSSVSLVRGYIGATRTGHTGTVLAPSDVMVRNFRCYKTYVDNDEVKRHILDPFNYGLKTPYYSNFVFNDNQTYSEFFPRTDSLVLNWDFEYPEETDEATALTGSTATITSPLGQYNEVLDISSGSLKRVGSPLPGQTNPDNIATEPVYKYHPGRAVGFDSGSSLFRTKYYQMLDLNVPGNLHDYDLINIEETNPNTFTKRTRPTNMFFSIESSMYGLISEEMLHMFSTIQQFNNYIGNPVNKYRIEYKELKKLREIYFRKIERQPDFDKFVNYYKWLDSSITYLVQDLFPVSAEHSSDIRTVIESHVLERNKYQHKYTNMISGTSRERQFAPTGHGLRDNPNLNFNNTTKLPPPVGGGNSSAQGPNNDNRENSNENDRGGTNFADVRNFHVTPDGTSKAGITALRITKDAADPEITSGDVGVDATRQAIRNSARVDLGRRTTVNMAFVTNMKGGTNARRNQNIFAWTGLRFGDTIVATPSATSSAQERIDNEASFPERKQRIEYETVITDNAGVTTLTTQKIAPGAYYETNNTVDVEIVADDGSTVGTELVALHEDGYASQLNNPYESSLNGSPYISDKVGGFFHRHHKVAATDRREGYVFTNGTTFERTFGTTPVTLWRFPKIKRPLSIRNIKTTADSVGNYSASYEIAQIVSGRRENNLAASDGRAVVSSSFAETPFLNNGQSASFGTTGLTERTLDDGNYNRSVFVQRFSSPGDKYTMSEGYLDTYAGEYSVYNSLNFRNLVVRTVLRNNLSAKTEKFTLDTGSIHGIYQNPLKVIKSSSLGVVATSSVFDNFFVIHPIPRSDSQYTWITGSAILLPLGYQTGSLVNSNHSGIDFLNVLLKTGQAPVDFTSLNTRVVETFNVTASVLGGTDSSEAFVNTKFGVLGDQLNARLLNRNGPFGWPIWKQIRSSQNPVTRWQNRNNVHSVNSVIGAENRLVNDGKNLFLSSSVVTVKYRPVQHSVETKKGPATYRYTHAAEKDLTPHQVLDDGIYDKRTMHDVLFELYSDTKVPEGINPVKSFNSLIYKEGVWPREVNALRNTTRTRKKYISPFWKDSRDARTTTTKVNSCGIATASSIWPLDADSDWTIGTATAETGNLTYNFASGTRGELLTFDGSPAYAATRLQYVTNIGAIKDWDIYTTMPLRLPSLEIADNPSRNPYHNNERDFERNTKLAGQGMSVIPEFSFSKILDNPEIDPAQGIGNSVLKDLIVFTLTGSFNIAFSDLASTTKGPEFLGSYLLTDPVQFAPSDYGPTSQVSLTFRALKKFKPYDGFYPAERVLQLSSMLSSSIKDIVTLAGPQRTARTMIQPFTSPGILLNSIKSGIAVDYPLVTSSVVAYNAALAPTSGSLFGTHLIEYSATLNGGTGLRRLPFEALRDPIPYLFPLGSTGWHDNSAGPEYLTNSTASITQAKVEHRTILYTKAIDNFETEVEYMNLEGGGAEILFPAERKWNSFEVNETYKGRISLMSNDFLSCGNVGGYGPNFLYTNIGGLREIFNPFVPSFVEAARKLDESSAYSVENNHVELTFIPSSSKPTVHDVLGTSTRTFKDWRTLDAIGTVTALADVQRDLMAITASLNIDEIVVDPGTQVTDDNRITTVDDAQTSDKIWRIRPKWQTPAINFVNVLRDLQAAGASGDLLELHKNQTSIWTTAGEVPSKNTSNGVFMILDEPNDGSKSLWDAIGIPREDRRKRIGEVRESFEIKEAVVAVPMRIDPVTQDILFFNLCEDHHLYEQTREALGEFLFPPRFDFARNPQFSPVVMHVFEFSTELSEVDLCAIWQNTNVNLGRDDNFEIKEKTIVDLTTFDDMEFTDEIRWMIFKVKQRAIVNKRSITEFGQEVGQDLTSKYSYNWPYDYFSLIELGELEISLKFGEDTRTTKMKPLQNILIDSKSQAKIDEKQEQKSEVCGMKQEQKTRKKKAAAREAESVTRGRK